MLAMYLSYPTQPAHVTMLADLQSVYILCSRSFSSCLSVVQQAENVSHNLGVPVLRHPSMKPSRRTIGAIQRYFASLHSPISDPRQLIVIGDRVFTDVVIANKLGGFSVLVSRDWSPTIKSRVSGTAELAAVRLARRLLHTPHTSSSNLEFTRVLERKDEVKMGYSGSTWTWAGRALGLGPNSGKHR
jgi:Mitochondrial PGP phosphatase